MTSRVAAALAVLLASLAASRARAADGAPPTPPLLRNEAYATTGLTYYASQRRVLAGVGGGGGYSFRLTRMFAVYAEGRYAIYTGNTFTGALGASASFPIGPLDPLVGLQGTIYGGDRVDVIDSEHPVPPSALAWAAQLRLSPLRFVTTQFTVTTLSGDVGFGIDSGSRALAVTVTFLDIGFRF